MFNINLLTLRELHYLSNRSYNVDSLFVYPLKISQQHTNYIRTKYEHTLIAYGYHKTICHSDPPGKGRLGKVFNSELTGPLYYLLDRGR
jgi:hypothetical protein